jgi:hypothetical protein
MKKYCWSSASFQANAQKVGEELEEIEILGELDSNSVLKYAKENRQSELSKCFEWDDKIAGEKYRMQQACQVLCSISIAIKEEPVEKERVYVNVVSSNSGKKKYKNINEVLKNDEEYYQLVSKAKSELTTYKEKYQKLVNKEDLKELIFEIYKEI